MRGLAGSFLLMILLCDASCAPGPGLVRSGIKDLLYFKFFIFLKTGEDTLNGNGDAVIVKDKIMKLRIYDNVMGNLLFKFSTKSDGKNSVILPGRQVAYIKYDSVFPVIMTHYLYSILSAENIDPAKDMHIKDVVTGENGLKQIKFTYLRQNITIVIEKRYSDGRPERINCIIDSDSLLFDITCYESYDFTADTEGYREMIDDSGKSLFEWLGDFYAER
jgi:hypothetical protein